MVNAARDANAFGDTQKALPPGERVFEVSALIVHHLGQIAKFTMGVQD